MDESLALNETCLDTKFIFVGTMVIELCEFNEKKK